MPAAPVGIGLGVAQESVHRLPQPLRDLGAGLDGGAPERHEQRVRAPRRVRSEPHRAAEARAVHARAGEADDRGRLATAEPELVARAPAHHLVERLDAGGVAGARAEDHPRREGRGHLLEVHAALALSVPEEDLRRRQEELLQRAPWQRAVRAPRPRSAGCPGTRSASGRTAWRPARSSACLRRRAGPRAPPSRVRDDCARHVRDPPGSGSASCTSCPRISGRFMPPSHAREQRPQPVQRTSWNRRGWIENLCMTRWRNCSVCIGRGARAAPRPPATASFAALRRPASASCSSTSKHGDVEQTAEQLPQLRHRGESVFHSSWSWFWASHSGRRVTPDPRTPPLRR